MRISDWSSDVCSSDLGLVPASNPPRAVALEARWTPEPSPGRRGEVWRWPHSGLKQRALHRLAADRAAAVAPGEIGRASCRERVSVRVDLGGRRIIQKTKKEQKTNN